MSEDDPKFRDRDLEAVRQFVKEKTGVDVIVKVVDGRFVLIDPDGQEMETGLVRKQ